MTRELLQKANEIDRGITELEIQCEIVESMLHDSEYLWISDHANGEVLLGPEARLDIISTVLSDIDDRKEELEDKLRRL